MRGYSLVRVFVMVDYLTRMSWMSFQLQQGRDQVTEEVVQMEATCGSMGEF